MKKLLISQFLILCMLPMSMHAAITSYTFTTIEWKSTLNGTPTDGKTDGFISNKNASSADAKGRLDASGRLYNAGVSVKTGTSGAGATSVKTFNQVRRITVNFCQNASDGRGTIYFQIGANTPIPLPITKPASGQGVYNRDSVILLPSPQSGTIRFWVECSHNAINIHSLTIRHTDGGSSPFTVPTYQRVTSTSQLRDSDQIIISAFPDNKSYIMGYFDASVSKNNIHAISAHYSDDRSQVSPDDRAIYTLIQTQLPESLQSQPQSQTQTQSQTQSQSQSQSQTCYHILDTLRYSNAYLVASGGQTKNRLALWDHPYDPDTYGAYGYWDITITPDGQASILNLGRSKGNLLQFNAVNNPPLFGCYAQPDQTPVSIYHLVPALGDTTLILAPSTHFGTQLLTDTLLTVSRQILIQANGLHSDIHASLSSHPSPLTTHHSPFTSHHSPSRSETHLSPSRSETHLSPSRSETHPSPFTLSENIIDRDGDYLTITCTTSQPGTFCDTLILTSDSIRTTALITITVQHPMTIAQAVTQAPFTQVWLHPVTVTKKYDTYIFIRDSTGSMLIYDAGDGTGHRYGAGLENGHVLRNVTGRMKDYFGVPELIPTQAFTVDAQKVSCPPIPLTTPVDSTHVCQYISIHQSTIDPQFLLTSPVQTTPISVVDAFDIGVQTGTYDAVDAIVMLSWDQLQLWCTKQHTSTDLPSIYSDPSNPSNPYDPSNPTDPSNQQNKRARKLLTPEGLFIQLGNKLYTPLGLRR